MFGKAFSSLASRASIEARVAEIPRSNATTSIPTSAGQGGLTISPSIPSPVGGGTNSGGAVGVSLIGRSYTPGETLPSPLDGRTFRVYERSNVNAKGDRMRPFRSAFFRYTAGFVGTYLLFTLFGIRGVVTGAIGFLAGTVIGHKMGREDGIEEMRLAQEKTAWMFRNYRPENEPPSPQWSAHSEGRAIDNPDGSRIEFQ